MLTHPQRLVRLDPTGRTLFRRASRVYGDKVCALTLALVLKHPEERPPRGPGSISRIAQQFDQPGGVQVLDGHKVVLADVVRREFVQEVSTLALQVGVSAGDRLALFFPVVRAVFFPRD